MTFRIAALPASVFAGLYGLSDAALRARGIVPVVADLAGAFPCRVSLEDAKVGERLLLLNYEHQPAETPFRSRHAIFVRDGATEAAPSPGEVPDMIARRLLSVRSFDSIGMMLDGEVIDGEAAAACFESMLTAPRAAVLHVHSARRGCYLARVSRAGPEL
jgi:hypothetical protein